ncbi:hypothetical protein MUP95_09045, partial [bacterium]|nr:hypothetical protein [bacterium]
MKNRKEIIKIGCLIGSIFLLLSNGRGESTLQSIKKGGEGIRTWAVLYFDEEPVWAGVSQSEENKLTLFFAGNSGELNGSITSLNPANDRRIVINQLSESPAVFGADIICNGNIPLVILKNEGHMVIALNDLSLLNEKLTEPSQALMITPCRLIGVTPDIQDDQMVTSIRFDGNYEWKGYIRPSNKSAALLIEGAQLGNMEDQYLIEEGPLQNVRFISDSSKPYEMKVLLFFSIFSHFTIARKPQSLFIQTPYTDVKTSPQIVQAEVMLPAVSTDQQKTEIKLMPIEENDETALQKMIDEMIQSDAEQKKEEEPAIEQETVDESGSRVELEEWGGISDEMASIVGEIEKAESGSNTSSIPENQAQKAVIQASPVVEEEASAIPWNQEVSFRFQETPIKDVLRLIATSNNINIVIGEDVKGNVTMNLEGVTLKQALEKVIYMHNSEYIVDEDIIIVKSMDVKYKGGMITKVYHLKYADAKNIAVVIRRIVTNDTLVQVFYPEFLAFQNEEKISAYETQGSSGGMGGTMGGGAGTVMEAGMNRMMNNPEAIQGIRRSSILVVTDRPDKIREVDKVIQELDKVPVQFIIESKLVELRPSYNKDLGIDWDGALGLLWNKEATS